MSKYRVGNPPVDLGLIDIKDDTLDEMLFWLYCPISYPGLNRYVLPDNLDKFTPLVDKVWSLHEADSKSLYFYITAKTLYVDENQTGQRPGWHIDGYGSSDTNYIWYTNNPTEFAVGEMYISVDDHRKSMEEMEIMAKYATHVTYANRHLLKLDQTVVHRTRNRITPGIRTFVKISVSRDFYNLRGNSINHRLSGIKRASVERSKERNHPVGVIKHV